MKVTDEEIQREEKACRRAFRGRKVGSYAWHCHHRVLCEKLFYPPKERIDYIVKKKPRRERAIRLRLFRPVSRKVAQAKIAQLEELHRQECPNCPWTGRTIFPRKKKS